MHAQLVTSLLAASSEKNEIAVITPFAPQARLLDAAATSDAQHASTIHRFQGGEADVVVYDTVDASSGVPRLHPWFRDGQSGGEGARLLNVAVSRSREALLVVADLGRIHHNRRGDDAVAAFLHHLGNQAQPLDAIALLAKPRSATALVLEHLERLRADIAHTAGDIELWLPGCTPDELTAVMPELTGAVTQGREVTVWVDPRTADQWPHRTRDATRRRINMRPLEPLFESGAIIGDVVWTSSGQLLCNQLEIRLRTQSRALADGARSVMKRRTYRVPGSGQPAARCKHCHRALVRVESQGARGTGSVKQRCRQCD